jgi:hypothetical protein
MEIIQPMVAKLPWVIVPIYSSTLKGLPRRVRNGDATSLGLNLFWGIDPASPLLAGQARTVNAGLNDSIPLGLAGCGRRSRVWARQSSSLAAGHKRRSAVWPGPKVAAPVRQPVRRTRPQAASRSNALREKRGHHRSVQFLMVQFMIAEVGLWQ